MSRDDFEQRAYLARLSSDASWLEARHESVRAREWYEETYRKKTKDATLAPNVAKAGVK